MTRLILALAAAVALAGCASVQTPLDDGYQFGDLGDLRDQYCANADPHRRAIVLALMYQAGVRIPPSGACTDIIALVPNVPDLDVEQAERDRARFEGMADDDRDTTQAADDQGTE